MANPVQTGSDAAAYGFAVASLVVPVVVGLVLAVPVRRLVARARLAGLVSGFVLLLLPVAAAFIPPLTLVRIGFWDRVLTGLLVGLGLLLGAHAAAARIERRNWIVLAVATVAALGLLEAAAAWLLPRAPTFEEPWECSFVLDPWGEYALEEEACKMLYPAEFSDRLRGRLHAAHRVDPGEGSDASPPVGVLPGDGADRGATRAVLHVGDSLVYMTEPGGKTFPEILSSMEPGTAHVNAGVPGVGPDYYYLLVRNWTREVRVDLVVLHLFIGNDLDDIDSARSCADYGPLLEYGEATGEAAAPAGDSGQAGDSALSRAPGAGGGQVMPEARVRPRFGGPAWGSLLGSPLMASPPPYAVRVASGFSRAARVFQERYYRLAQATLNAQPEETRWEHLAAVLAATRDELRARGVPLVLVLMPHRPWLLDERFRVRGDGMRARIEKMASGLSVPVLVPWEDFEQAVQEQGLDRWFLGGVEDNHFSTAGHRWMADWLQPRLARLKSSTQ